MMDGGDLKTLNRWHGGDSRQHGGIYDLLGKLLGLGPESCLINNMAEYLVCWENYSGLDLESYRSQMSDPIKQQMIMQRGGFPWALPGLSLLPALLGKGEHGDLGLRI